MCRSGSSFLIGHDFHIRKRYSAVNAYPGSAADSDRFCLLLASPTNLVRQFVKSFDLMNRFLFTFLATQSCGPLNGIDGLFEHKYFHSNIDLFAIGLT